MSIPAMVSARGETYALYQYTPSVAAAVIFLILFFCTTAMHIFQAGRRKTYYFIPLIIGGIFECIGYVGRALGHSHMTNIPIYIMMTITLLVAPALFAASIYMVLGRIIVFTRSENLSPIRPSRLTKMFVCGDVLSFLIQSGGGAMEAKASSQNLGKKLILFGLFLQIVFFGIFIITSAIFHKRALRFPIAPAASVWQKYMFTLYIAGGLILIRSVFRMIEFGSGRDSILQKSEVYLYIFDAVLMFFVMVCFNVVHPGAIIGRKGQDLGEVIILSGGESDGEFSRLRK